MSVMTGLWNFQDTPLEAERLESVAGYASQYGPDSCSNLYLASVGMIYQSFNSVTDSPANSQPHSLCSGTTMMWDGRLDNKEDLDGMLRHSTKPSNSLWCRSAEGPLSDIDIIHAFYDQYGAEGLVKIVGDWALSIWDERNRRLTLSCDFCGSRHLYYCKLPSGILWCTDLKALVAGSGCKFELCDAYIADYLEGMPAASYTPYSEIKAVPPGHFVEITQTAVTIRRYWRWDTSAPIIHKSDAEYEDHFRHNLRQAVRRRLRSKYPVVAELSGGVDSSSIVCVADDIRKANGDVAPAIHTLSYYDDDEPTCDERPFFSIIEQLRGCVGTHINSAKYARLSITLPAFLPVPLYPQGVVEAESDRWEVMRQHSARIVLSGIGGDEFLGGVPTGIPELADLVRNLDLTGFGNGLVRWSGASGIPYWQLFQGSIRSALTFGLRDYSRFVDRTTSLLSETFSNASGAVRSSESTRWGKVYVSPSQRMFIEAWCGIHRHLAYRQPPMFGCYESAFPYLDRDLLMYLINIPRSQVIRAGVRRSLMRRSLVSIVPHDVLWRKNKATATRRYMRVLSESTPELVKSISQDQSLSVQYGYIDPTKFVNALRKACNGMSEYHHVVMRVIGLESWLRTAIPYVSKGCIRAQRSCQHTHSSYELKRPGFQARF